MASNKAGIEPSTLAFKSEIKLFLISSSQAVGQNPVMRKSWCALTLNQHVARWEGEYREGLKRLGGEGGIRLAPFPASRGEN